MPGRIPRDADKQHQLTRPHTFAVNGEPSLRNLMRDRLRATTGLPVLVISTQPTPE
jgi:hypothetical protein